MQEMMTQMLKKTLIVVLCLIVFLFLIGFYRKPIFSSRVEKITLCTYSCEWGKDEVELKDSEVKRFIQLYNLSRHSFEADCDPCSGYAVSILLDDGSKAYIRRQNETTLQFKMDTESFIQIDNVFLTSYITLLIEKYELRLP